MKSNITTIDHPYLCGACNYIAIDIWDQALHLGNEHNSLYENFDYAMSIGAQDPYAAITMFEEMIDHDPITLIYKLNLELTERTNASGGSVDNNTYGAFIDTKSLVRSVNRLTGYIKEYPKSIELYLDIAITYNLIEDFNQSIKYWKKAIELDGSPEHKIIKHWNGRKTIQGLTWQDWRNYTKALFVKNNNSLRATWNLWRLKKFNPIHWFYLLLGLVSSNPFENNHK